MRDAGTKVTSTRTMQIAGSARVLSWPSMTQRYEMDG
jgi:hypothetical protein